MKQTYKQMAVVYHIHLERKGELCGERKRGREREREKEREAGAGVEVLVLQLPPGSTTPKFSHMSCGHPTLNVIVYNSTMS